MYHAELCGMIKVNDVICGVNGHSVEMASFAQTVKLISEVNRCVRP